MSANAIRDLRFDLSSGKSDELGATFDGEGTNFALFSQHATGVDLVLFDGTGKAETFCSALPRMEGGIWFGYLPGLKPGQLYGYRVHGPYAPEDGHRFNPHKLVLDPYAFSIQGDLVWDDALFGYQVGQDHTSFDPRDSAPFMPKAVVTERRFDWDADPALNHRWQDTFLYEAHVKGLTMLHPDVPDAERGTFQGLGSDAVIAHLQRIGVTAIELLPIHGFLHDRHLLEKGLRNYWGYNTLSFFSPHPGYLKTGQIHEIQVAIKRFHAAGIEVILDVVFNHTAEGNEMGPTLSFRGIDHATYYMLAEDRAHCHDVTGTGNSLNVAHPMVLRLVLDSLRYWVQVMHVDGFRFDLAPTLGREATGFEREGAFFAALRQDPVLSRIKLIAEPWDVGDGGYQVGGFPWPFREWNDKFRDDLRSFWRKDPGLVPRLSQRLAGSPRQFNHSHRPATSSINFLAAHDGFTLRDVVSYSETHNEANGEQGADGHRNNLGDNLGTEGPTDDPATNESRARRVRAMLATLLMSQGVPMLLAGDEMGQTQGGNNNTYCQDNETTWLNWDAAHGDLVQVVADLVALRRAAGGLAASKFGRAEADGDAPVLIWLHPRGTPMEDDDWQDTELRVLGMQLDRPGQDTLLALFNAGDDCTFALPDGAWRKVLDTTETPVTCDTRCQGELRLGWQSVAALRPCPVE